MDKYWMFRAALDFMADRSDVTKAYMYDNADHIVIEGEDTDGNLISLRISIARKEPSADGNKSGSV